MCENGTLNVNCRKHARRFFKNIIILNKRNKKSQQHASDECAYSCEGRGSRHYRPTDEKLARRRPQLTSFFHSSYCRLWVGGTTSGWVRVPDNVLFGIRFSVQAASCRRGCFDTLDDKSTLGCNSLRMTGLTTDECGMTYVFINE